MVPHNLFIGRQKELQELLQLVDEGGLVLVRGGWGVGKSALLERFAQQVASEDPEVELMRIRVGSAISDEDVVEAFARTLGLESKADRGTLARALRARGSFIALLDDCSEFDDSARKLLGFLSEEAPTSSFVCASRAALDVGEARVELRGLSIARPDSEAFEALKVLSRDEIDVPHEGGQRLCEILEGNPLAIELCAGLLRLMPVEALEQAIVRGKTGLLNASNRAKDAVGRFSKAHWERLNGTHRAALLRLAVSPNGAGKTSSIERATVLIELERLGLTQTREGRTQLPALVRQVVLELGKAELAEVKAAWASEIVRAAESLWEKHGFGSLSNRDWFLEESEALETISVWGLEGEIDLSLGARACIILSEHACAEGRGRVSLPKAYTRALGTGPLKRRLSWVAAAAAIDQEDQRDLDELLTYLEGELAAADDDEEIAEILAVLISNAVKTGNFEEVDRLVERHGSFENALFLDKLGVSLSNRGRIDAAIEHFRRASSISRAQNRLSLAISAERRLGGALAMKGELSAAIKTLEPALTVAVDLQQSVRAARIQFWLGYCQLGQGNADAAGLLLEECRETLRRLGTSKIMMAAVEMALGDVSIVKGEYEKAELLYEGSIDNARAVDWKIPVGESLLRLHATHRAANHSTPQDADEALAILGHPDRDAPHIRRWLAFGDAAKAASLCDVTDRMPLEECVAARALQTWLRTTSGSIIPPKAFVRVATATKWLELPDGTRMHFRRDSPSRRVLSALVDARISEPGKLLERDTLIAAGWPEQKMLEKSARNRIWVTITRLRKVGLDTLIEHIADGYRLDPKVALVREPETKT